MENNFYVYALLDTRKPGTFRYGRWVFNYQPFYIGKGKGTRYTHHFTDCRMKWNSHKLNVIKKIVKETGALPISLIKKNGLTEQEAFDLEVKMIRTIGRTDLDTGPLTNKTDGGEGNAGRKLTKQHKERIGKANSNPSEATREKLRQKQLGVKLSAESIEKMRKAKTGQKHTKETKAQMVDSHLGRFAGRKRKVESSYEKKGNYRLSEEGRKAIAASKGKGVEVIQGKKCMTFDTLTQAAKFLNLAISTVSRLAKGEIQHEGYEVHRA